MYEVRMKDIDPDTGHIWQDKVVATKQTTNTKGSKHRM